MSVSDVVVQQPFLPCDWSRNYLFIMCDLCPILNSTEHSDWPRLLAWRDGVPYLATANHDRWFNHVSDDGMNWERCIEMHWVKQSRYDPKRRRPNLKSILWLKSTYFQPEPSVVCSERLLVAPVLNNTWDRYRRYWSGHPSPSSARSGPI
jgi:hypothetical protein